MPKRGIDYCLDVVDSLAEEKNTEDDEFVVPADEVRQKIAILCGMKQSTRDRYWGLLLEFGLMRQAGDGKMIISQRTALKYR